MRGREGGKKEQLLRHPGERGQGAGCRAVGRWEIGRGTKRMSGGEAGAGAWPVRAPPSARGWVTVPFTGMVSWGRSRFWGLGGHDQESCFGLVNFEMFCETSK